MSINKLFSAVCAVVIAASFSAAWAEDAEDLKIGGKVFAQYNQELNNKDDANEEATNTFSVTRAYIQLKKKLGGPFSFKITADAIQLKSEGTDSNGDDVETETPYYGFFLKNAYLQSKNDLGAATLITQFGLIGTPIIGLAGKVSDYRWIYNDFIDKSKNLVGTSIDTSADLGISVKADIMKMVSITGAYMNGEGYKSVDEDPENAGKSLYGVISITPIKGLFINGYVRSENEDVDNSDMGYTPKDSTYYGGGLAWKSDLVKTGFNYVIGETDEDGTVTKEVTLLDFWLNTNLKSVIDVPVLILGRYAIGEETESDLKTTYIGAGLGYQFNKNVRVAAYYEQYKSDSYANDKQSNFSIKSEVRY